MTLIELIIAIAIIAIIAAIAIPNLLKGRMKANETAAITVVKAYAAGQVVFKVGFEGMVSHNSKAGQFGFCDNYRNLFYGTPKTDTSVNLVLISKAAADAFARPPADIAAITNETPTAATKTASSYQGYFFSEPNNFRVNDGDSNPFTLKFAILAVPATSGRSGSTAYWIGLEGTVMRRGLPYGNTETTSIEVAPPGSLVDSDKLWSAL